MVRRAGHSPLVTRHFFTQRSTIARMRFYAFLMGLALMAAPAAGQEIQRLDPALEQIVPQNARLEKIAGGLNQCPAGAVWTRNGTLLFAEIRADNIADVDPAQGASVCIR